MQIQDNTPMCYRQDNTLMCYRRGNRRTRRKTSPPPPSNNQSTRQLVVIHGLERDPPSLIYLLYLSPPSSYSNKTSQNRVLSSSLDPVTSSMLHSPTLASSNTSQQHQKHSLHSKKAWIVFGYKSPFKV